MGKKRKQAKGKAKFENDRNESVVKTLEKKEKIRKRLRIVQAQRNLDAEEKRLKYYFEQTPTSSKKRAKGPSRPDEWKLKGAARPAALIAKIAAGELDADGNPFYVPPETTDLFQQKSGQFGQGKETKKFLTLLHELADACSMGGLPDRAIQHYERCMQLDKMDTTNAKQGLVCSLLDEGRAGEARAIMDKYKDDVNTTFAYSRVLMEYVAWEILEEEGSSEEIVLEEFKKAFEINPFISVFIKGFETFTEVVEYVDEIKEPAVGSIEEAFVYCSKNAGVWLDTNGLREWIELQLLEFEIPLGDESSCKDAMYLGMYQTAVEMMIEEENNKHDDEISSEHDNESENES